MFFECKVYDNNGDLTKTHSVAEMEERSMRECRAMLNPADMERIKRFGDTTPTKEVKQ